MTVTLHFADRYKDGKYEVETVRIATADELKQLAQKHNITTVAACVVSTEYGTRLRQVGEKIEIRDESETVPLPINALSLMERDIDKYKTCRFFAW